MKDIIKLTNVIKKYNRGKPNEFQALNSASLSIVEGELICIMGVSGSGKSTILHIISCLDTYEGGSVTYRGKELKAMTKSQLNILRSTKISIILQDLALIPDDTVFENVRLPLMFDKTTPYKDIKRKTQNAISAVNLSSKYENHKIYELSGGQKQRVAIAKSIISCPDVLLADEPTASLDKKSSQEIIDLFKKINKEKHITVVIVTHDYNIAKQCDRVIEISDGKIIAENCLI